MAANVPMFKFCSWVRFPTFDGIDPVNPLSAIVTNFEKFISLSLDTQDGRDTFVRIVIALPRSRRVKDVAFPTSSGIPPVKLLLPLLMSAIQQWNRLSKLSHDWSILYLTVRL